MTILDIIGKKRDGLRLEEAEIAFFVRGVTDGSVPDYQAAALLMAAFLRGLDAGETAALTAAMLGSGTRLDLSDIPRPKVDKHSTGGVGDKTSLIVAPVCAALGLCVPMIAGRGLGHTGGTVDKLAAIPGFRTDIGLREFRRMLAAEGLAIIGQTGEIAPADRKLYALRDATATVPSIPLIAASIMSKKLAEGLDALVLDVKAGRGAFMRDTDSALRLARVMTAAGAVAGVRVTALITAMDRPLGSHAGNALEVAECLRLLAGERPDGSLELLELCLALCARMLVAGGMAEGDAEGRAMAEKTLSDGRALERFRAMLTAQGADPRVADGPALLPSARVVRTLAAGASGYVADIDALLVGRACVLLGAGRLRAEDSVDPAAGVVLLARHGQMVEAGEPLLEAHCSDESRLAPAMALLQDAVRIEPQPPARHHEGYPVLITDAETIP